MPDTVDLSRELQEKTLAATAVGGKLRIRGAGTKRFYGRDTNGAAFDVAGHTGIVVYEPTELVITARCGTPLSTIESALAEHNQMLAFEPPHFGEGATLGGTIACGFSGPRRPYAGSARDFVLGTKILNGRGEILTFGGQVMKNVAGFDVSRLMVGSLGTLGILLEVSLKILPKPLAEITLAHALNPTDAIRQMNAWAARPVPLSAACYDGDTLYIRLSGAAASVRAAQARLGGDIFDGGEAFWHKLREHQHDFFAGDTPLWRLSVPPATPPLNLPGKWLLDWGGAQRWLKSGATPEDIYRVAKGAGGHATLFRGGDRRADVFHPLPTTLMTLHRSLKSAFDPKAVLNAGVMYRT